MSKWEVKYGTRIVAQCAMKGLLQNISNSVGEREDRIRKMYRYWHNKDAAREQFEQFHERVTIKIKVEE